MRQLHTKRACEASEGGLTMSKDEIKQILMTRDNMSEHDAKELIAITQNEIDDLMLAQREPDLFDIEDIVRDNLGLEPDFVEVFI
jgi:hypothetical protein